MPQQPRGTAASASSTPRPVSCRHRHTPRRVAWSSDLEPRLSTITDERLALDDWLTDVAPSSRNSHTSQRGLRTENSTEFEVFEMDRDSLNPSTPSADRQEGQEDEVVVSQTARERRVLFFTERARPAESQPDVEMRDSSPCFSDTDGF